jgi:RimJ/RimL family protein N-acetyltransferase
VAFVVGDDWQNHGIGTFQLKHLMRIARRNGIRGFTAEVLTDNKAMQAVINKSNCKMRRFKSDFRHRQASCAAPRAPSAFI